MVNFLRIMRVRIVLLLHMWILRGLCSQRAISDGSWEESTIISTFRLREIETEKD